MDINSRIRNSRSSGGKSQGKVGDIDGLIVGVRVVGTGVGTISNSVGKGVIGAYVLTSSTVGNAVIGA